jgi:hypothetical protein
VAASLLRCDTRNTSHCGGCSSYLYITAIVASNNTGNHTISRRTIYSLNGTSLSDYPRLRGVVKCKYHLL